MRKIQSIRGRRGVGAMVEGLEARALFSAIGVNLVGSYAGTADTESFTSLPAGLRFDEPYTVKVTSQSSDGAIAGVMRIVHEGSFAFTGQLDGDRITIQFTGSSTGSISGKILTGGNVIAGTFTDTLDGTDVTGNFRVNKNGDISVGTTGVGSTSGTTTSSGGSTSSDNGDSTSGFTGVYAGNVDSTPFTENPDSLRENEPFTLKITGQDSEGNLSGVMRIVHVGSFDVVGTGNSNNLFNLTLTGSGTGTMDGSLRSGGNRIVGDVAISFNAGIYDANFAATKSGLTSSSNTGVNAVTAAPGAGLLETSPFPTGTGASSDTGTGSVLGTDSPGTDPIGDLSGSTFTPVLSSDLLGLDIGGASVNNGGGSSVFGGALSSEGSSLASVTTFNANLVDGAGSGLFSTSAI